MRLLEDYINSGCTGPYGHWAHCRPSEAVTCLCPLLLLCKIWGLSLTNPAVNRRYAWMHWNREPNLGNGMTDSQWIDGVP